MTTVRDRLTDREVRVKYLEDNATPGRVDALGQTSVDTRRQLQALQEGLADFRGEMAKFQADMIEFRDEAFAEFAALKGDVTTLKGDMAEVRSAVREILRRLPPSAL